MKEENSSTGPYLMYSVHCMYEWMNRFINNYTLQYNYILDCASITTFTQWNYNYKCSQIWIDNPCHNFIRVMSGDRSRLLLRLRLRLRLRIPAPHPKRHTTTNAIQTIVSEAHVVSKRSRSIVMYFRELSLCTYENVDWFDWESRSNFIKLVKSWSDISTQNRRKRAFVNCF